MLDIDQLMSSYHRLRNDQYCSNGMVNPFPLLLSLMACDKCTEYLCTGLGSITPFQGRVTTQTSAMEFCCENYITYHFGRAKGEQD
jgi:hypothetical protein